MFDAEEYNQRLKKCLEQVIREETTHDLNVELVIRMRAMFVHKAPMEVRKELREAVKAGILGVLSAKNKELKPCVYYYIGATNWKQSGIALQNNYARKELNRRLNACAAIKNIIN